MKFRCIECRAVFYSDEPLGACSLCGGEVQEEQPQERARCRCAGREAEIELCYGIPICEYFVLNNAPGSRCTYFALPRRCRVERLPEYQPRAGLVEK
ncbi:MAG: hypothetical protein NUW06_05805 [Candidatus Acetothermia bacterium]|nr:hypothetical protein [Candidatus Acetothermia bacterium]MDH7505799.1 hypothetical protein [Candidatus Acetothermia bacterium]